MTFVCVSVFSDTFNKFILHNKNIFMQISVDWVAHILLFSKKTLKCKFVFFDLNFIEK